MRQPHRAAIAVALVVGCALILTLERHVEPASGLLTLVDDAHISETEGFVVDCHGRMHVSTSTTVGGCEDANCSRTARPEELELWPLPAHVSWQSDGGDGNASAGQSSAGVVAVRLANDFRFIVEPVRERFRETPAAAPAAPPNGTSDATPGAVPPSPPLQSAADDATLMREASDLRHSLERFCTQLVVAASSSDESKSGSGGQQPSGLSGEASAIRQLHVQLTLAGTPLQLTTLDEAYVLTVGGGGEAGDAARLRARTVHGVLKGLETFTQLWTDRAPALGAPAAAVLVERATHVKRDATPALALRVEDAPAARWRGLLVDVSRHYVPLSLLRRTIDAMAAVKLNTLHLHLTDSQSFPLLLDDDNDNDNDGSARAADAKASATQGGHGGSDDDDTDVLDPHGPVPAGFRLASLAEAGAYSATETYSSAQLRVLVAYARARGVRVVPEIDVPAHTAAWGAARPALIAKCPRAAAARESPSDVYALDPTRNATHAIVRAVVRAVARVFDDEFIHLGADEIHQECWREDAALMARLRAQHAARTGSGAGERSLSGDTSLILEALQSFEDAALIAVREVGRRPVLWQGALDAGLKLPEDVVIEPWKCWSGLNSAVAQKASKGGHAVLDASCWYLDWALPWTNYYDARFVGVSSPRRRHLGTRRLGHRLPANASKPTPLAARHAVVRNAGAALADTELSALFAAHTSRSTAPPHVVSTAQRQHRRRVTSVPVPEPAAAESQEILLGGEAAIWTEMIDLSNFECRLWPRAAAVAERLWRGGAAGTAKGAAGAVAAARFARAVPPLLAARGVRDVAPLGADSWAQCPPFPNPTQGGATPWHRMGRPTRAAVSQLNIDNGGGGDAGRVQKIVEWLAGEAVAGALLVGLCEANGWDKADATLAHGAAELKARAAIEARAAKAGFAHSHVWAPHGHPYSIAVVAAVPIEVIDEWGPPEFERGVLHVALRMPRLYVTMSGEEEDDDEDDGDVAGDTDVRLHVFVAHLNAHNASARVDEAQRIADAVAGLGADTPALVMGDLNTLSPIDAPRHEAAGLLAALKAAPPPAGARLQQKYLETGMRQEGMSTPPESAVGAAALSNAALAYGPMRTLLSGGRGGISSSGDHGGGLVDLCAEPCRRTTNVGGDGGGHGAGDAQRHLGKHKSGVSSRVAATPIVDGTHPDLNTSCVAARCARTEPTSLHDDPMLAPAVRVDFILANPAFARHAGRLGGERAGARVLIEPSTEALSDHYPMRCEWGA